VADPEGGKLGAMAPQTDDRLKKSRRRDSLFRRWHLAMIKFVIFTTKLDNVQYPLLQTLQRL